MLTYCWRNIVFCGPKDNGFSDKVFKFQIAVKINTVLEGTSLRFRYMFVKQLVLKGYSCYTQCIVILKLCLFNICLDTTWKIQE